MGQSIGDGAQNCFEVTALGDRKGDGLERLEIQLDYCLPRITVLVKAIIRD